MLGQGRKRGGPSMGFLPRRRLHLAVSSIVAYCQCKVLPIIIVTFVFVTSSLCEIDAEAARIVACKLLVGGEIDEIYLDPQFRAFGFQTSLM